MKLVLTIAMGFIPLVTIAKIKVATTTTDIASIVREVGQDQVEVFSIAKGTQDPHLIEAKPSFMVKLRDVEVLFSHGLELETGWVGPLIQGARNPKLNQSDRHIEIAPRLKPIDVKKGPVSRADGDVHPGGNPHFQLDPLRVGDAAFIIAEKLSDLKPDQKAVFQKNAESFKQRLNQKTIEWKDRIRKTKVTEVVTYHKTFGYFCSRFEIKCTTQIEPKPGIPPSAAHLLSVVEHMKNQNVGIVLIENVYEDKVGAKLKQHLPKVQVFVVPIAAEGEPGIRNHVDLMERLVSVIEQGAK